jgi:hypothetical protein
MLFLQLLILLALGLGTSSITPVPTGAESVHRTTRSEALCGLDCNQNGVEDAVDISFGSSSDSNSNGIPDECEE